MVTYIVHIIYLLTSLWLMIVVGNSLHKNGRVWIIDLLSDIHLSDKVNNTLLLLYRLVNVGYILITLMSGKLSISAWASRSDSRTPEMLTRS